MFETVNNALNGCGVSLHTEGGIVLISESLLASANPLVNHFMSLALSSHQKVYFVALQHTWSHYCNIGSKFGLNLRSEVEKGNVNVFEGLRKALEVTEIANDVADSHPFGFLVQECNHPLKNLYEAISNVVSLWRSSCNKFMIIFDNLSYLISLGVKTTHIRSFVHYCRTLIENQDSTSGPFQGSIVSVISADEADEDASHLVSCLAVSSTVHISMHGLSTGHNKNVHGHLNITARQQFCPAISLPTVVKLQYKIEEKNMKIFAPGTSAAVL